MSRLSSRCVRIIDRYQASAVAHAADGNCRFEPSCCTYMREAFTTRRFLAAWLLSAWRIMRCNPLTRPRSVDPVQRASRARPRPSALRTLFASLLLASLVTLLVGGVAGAQGITGNCTGTINGRHPSSMTKDNPLVVSKGQNVVVSGTLIGARETDTSLTDIKIDLISGIWSAHELRNGKGPTWGGTVNVDSYLRLGSGLYRVHGTADSSSGHDCRGDGYIQLDGGKLIAAVAAGVGTVGLAGSVLTPGTWRGLTPGKERRLDQTMDDLSRSLDEDIKRPIPGVAAPQAVRANHPLGGCCLVTLLSIPLMMVGMAGDVPTGAPDGTPAPGTVVSRHRVWLRGHAILGFFSGLLLGIGLTVFLQQQAVWILDIWTAIVLPVGLAILVAVRAWIGRPYDIIRQVS